MPILEPAAQTFYAPRTVTPVCHARGRQCPRMLCMVSIRAWRPSACRSALLDGLQLHLWHPSRVRSLLLPVTHLSNPNRVGVREVSFGTVDPFSLEAVQEYEQEYTRAQEDSKTVKAILLCSPHNPLGRCYSNQVLKAYMSLCGKLGLHLLADEIYGLSVFENPEMDDPVPFTSILSINPEGLMDPRKVHTQWGFSKDFGATGLRIGCVISQSNRPFLKSLESFSLFNFPSSLADKVAVSLLTDQEYIQKYIATYRSRLAESYRHVAQFLKEHEIPYRTSNASLFLMVNLSAMVPSQSVTDDDILALLRKEKVYAISGTAYRSEEPGWFRVVIAHPKYVLDEGLKRMLRALSQS
ncbi:hypothetical protein FALCPG4_017065 [Fusarium falciforme]